MTIGLVNLIGTNMKNKSIILRILLQISFDSSILLDFFNNRNLWYNTINSSGFFSNILSHNSNASSILPVFRYTEIIFI